ncbi:MAG: HPr kinase/phosphatase C-terminal domain-containing protein [Sphingomonas sp.]|jgi:serine kinase of HPr protein (carbohydrate metabolism regulator)
MLTDPSHTPSLHASETLHATCVAIGGRGVLIFGQSGAGKSDLALRLIDRGAALVSDDYTIVSAENGALFARAPANIAGKMEVRGLGIVPFPAVLQAPVAMAIELSATTDRLPEPRLRHILGIAVAAFSLNSHEASAPIKAEIAMRMAAAGGQETCR